MGEEFVRQTLRKERAAAWDFPESVGHGLQADAGSPTRIHFHGGSTGIRWGRGRTGGNGFITAVVLYVSGALSPVEYD